MLIQSFKGFALRGHHIHHKRVKVAPLKGKKNKKKSNLVEWVEAKIKRADLESFLAPLLPFLQFSSLTEAKMRDNTTPFFIQC